VSRSSSNDLLVLLSRAACGVLRKHCNRAIPHRFMDIHISGKISGNSGIMAAAGDSMSTKRQLCFSSVGRP